MSATKNRRKYNQHFKLLFFKINLHYGTSDYISTYGKLNLLPINSIFFVFPSRVMQRRLMQTKAYYKISLFSLKRSASKAFQSSRRKRVLPKCVYHWYNLLRWMFFIPCDNSKQVFFYTDLSSPRGLVELLCWWILSNKCFERSPHIACIIST